MFTYNSENCPSEIQNQVNGLIFSLQEFLGPLLSAVYLTGSLTKGDFMLGFSDLNMLIVVNKKLNPYKRLFIARKLMVWDKSPAPVHLCIVSLDNLADHPPVRLQFLFSDKEKKEYRRCLDEKNAESPLLTTDFLCRSLPAAIYSVRSSSVSLVGPSAKSLLPEISSDDFKHGVFQRLSALPWIPEDTKETVDHILRLCRLWHFSCVPTHLSKYDSALWAIGMISRKRSVLIKKCLQYRFEGQKIRKFKLPALLEFEKFIFSRISE